MKGETNSELIKSQFLACFASGSLKQRMGHLAMRLNDVDDALVTEALISVLLTVEDPEKQQLAGGLLWHLRPVYSRDLLDDIRASFTNWDLSVEEWPWYLCRAVGRVRMDEALRQLVQEDLPDVQQRALKTIEYWLNGKTIQETLNQQWSDYFAEALKLEEVTFIQLNQGWNADPNVPREQLSLMGDELTLKFRLNPYLYENTTEGDVGLLKFNGCLKYRLGAVNDEGFYRGQCRFSDTCPEWGEFYRIQGNTELLDQPTDWVELGGGGNKHYLFYLRDATFECVAEDFVFRRL